MPNFDFDVVSQLSKMSLVEAHSYLLKQGVATSDVGLYLGEYLSEVSGTTKRTFNYTTNFPANNANCTTTFVRKFVHDNWTDGEDVVLAGTADENGFNTHFNNILTDLDAVKADLARAYACMAEMRSGLRSLLDEIRVELNRLNEDVANLRKSGTSSAPPLTIDPNKIRKFVGVTKVGQEDYFIYDTGDLNYEMLRSTTKFTVPSKPLADPRLTAPGDFNKKMTEVPAILKEFDDGKKVKPSDIITKYGDLVLDNGNTVKDTLKLLPQEEEFTSANALVDRLGDLNAAVIRASGDDTSILIAIGAGTTNVADLQVAAVTTNTELATQLKAVGVEKVSDLQTVSVAELSNRLAGAGHVVALGEINKLRDVSNMIGRLRR